MTSYEQAMAIGDSPVKLLARLLDAMEVLKDEYRQRFLRLNYDFAGQRLLSDDGLLALKWRVRSFPEEPESYHNQQTNVGVVVVEDVGGKPIFAHELKVGQKFRFAKSHHNYTVKEGQLFSYGCKPEEFVPHVMMLTDVSNALKQLTYVILEPREARGYSTNMGRMAEVIVID